MKIVVKDNINVEIYYSFDSSLNYKNFVVYLLPFIKVYKTKGLILVKIIKGKGEFKKIGIFKGN